MLVSYYCCNKHQCNSRKQLNKCVTVTHLKDHRFPGVLRSRVSQSRCRQDWVSLGGSRRESAVLPCQLLTGCSRPLAPGPLLCFQSRWTVICSSLSHLCFGPHVCVSDSGSPPASPGEDPVRPSSPPDNPGSSPILSPFRTHFYEGLFDMEGDVATGSRDQDRGNLRGPLFEVVAPTTQMRA